MARSDPDKLAQALRANLRRRKGSQGPEGPKDGRAPERVRQGGLAPEAGDSSENPSREQG
jgi:hypothetical protein